MKARRLALVFLLAVAGPAWSQQAPTPRHVHDPMAHHGDPGTADEHAGHRGDPAMLDGHAGQHGDPSAGDEHAAHRAALESSRYAVTMEHYDVPDVELIDESGTSLDLRELLDADQPVALNFIFTTCTTICPVMTATFAQMRRELGPDADRVRLVSISIDPEYDRPEILAAYADRFSVGEGWTFLTGDGPDVSRVLLAFQAYFGSKMSHQPITLLKSPGSTSWVRIDGLASGKDLAHEVTARLLN